jgi:hypothetical protein
MDIHQSNEKFLLSGSAKLGLRKGTLYLTDKRLRFESPAGITHKNTFLEFDVPLTSIHVAGIEGEKLIVEQISGESKLPTLSDPPIILDMSLPNKWEISMDNPLIWEKQIRETQQILLDMM